MSTPSDYPFSAGADAVNLRELRDAYRLTAKNINGYESNCRPFVTGSVAYGDNASFQSTYINSGGYFKIAQNTIDIWFTMTWNGHAGSGNLQVVLPVNSMGHPAFIWSGTCNVTGLDSPLATSLILPPGSNTASVIQAGTSDPIPLNASGSITGHLRYVTQITRR